MDARQAAVSSDSQRLFSLGKKTAAVKTAMKRLANRSEEIKKPLLAG